MEIIFTNKEEFNRALGMMSSYHLGLYSDYYSPSHVAGRMLCLLHVKEIKLEVTH